MKLVIRSFEELNTHELYELLRVRNQVFVVEQQCPYQDIDGIDLHAVHMFYEQENQIYGCLRLFYKDEDHKTVQIGRVLSTERGRGIGRRLLHEGVKTAISRMKAEEIYLEAQTYAIGFYEREGFQAVSDEFLEDGIPHVKMIRKVSKEEAALQ